MGLRFKNELYKKKRFFKKYYTPGGLLQSVKRFRLKKFRKILLEAQFSTPLYKKNSRA